MTAEILPFPAARRVTLVHSITRRVLELPADSGELHIRHSLKVQATVMLRKGIDAERMAREIAALESAIRCSIWDAIMAPRDVR